MSEQTTRRPALIVEMDQEELACRMLEGMYGCKRPPGSTARQALATMPAQDREALMRGAMVAMTYLRECTQRGARTQ